MSKLVFLFVFILKIKNIFTQYIISLSPYQYKSKKIFNEYLESLNYNGNDDTLDLKIIITEMNISIGFKSISTKKNIKPYIDYGKKNCLIFAPFAITFNFKIVVNSDTDLGHMYYNLYYVYLNQSVENFNPKFNIILKEKEKKRELNYQLVLYYGDSKYESSLKYIINKHFFSKNKESIKSKIIKKFEDKINKEYNNSLKIKLSEFFFPNISHNIQLKFIKFPEMYNKESIMTFFSGNLNNDEKENVVNNINEEFKKFNEFQQTKKKFFINYSLLQNIINKSNCSNYEFEIVKNKISFSFPNNFFDEENWKDLINNKSSVNKILLFLKIKNVTLDNESNLKTNFEMIIKNESKTVLKNFDIEVVFKMEVDLKNTCSINICASKYNIVNINEDEKLVKEKMETILKDNLKKICLFEEGINLENEFFYIDEYYLNKTGIYLIGEDKRN